MMEIEWGCSGRYYCQPLFYMKWVPESNQHLEVYYRIVDCMDLEFPTSPGCQPYMGCEPLQNMGSLTKIWGYNGDMRIWWLCRNLHGDVLRYKVYLPKNGMYNQQMWVYDRMEWDMQSI